MACDVPKDRAVAVALGQLPHVRVGNLGSVVHAFCDQLLPADAAARLNGRVAVCLCQPHSVDGGLFHVRMVEHFATRDDVLACLVAACWVPGAMGWSSTDPALGCLDGVFCTDMDLYRAPPEHAGRACFVVSRPKAFMHVHLLQNLVVPDEATAIELYEEGRANALTR